MGSVTDWLTSIGTISAVVVSLSYTIFSHLAQKRRKRRYMIRRLRVLSEKLYHEVELIQQDESTKNITEMASYETLKIYQEVIMFTVDDSNEDILLLGNNLMESFCDYFQDRSEGHKEICLSLLKQTNEIK